jgi:uncharacterized protein
MSISLLLVGLFSLSASIFSFFTGFGLVTVLTPCFLFYFPLEIAIPLAATIHLIDSAYRFLFVAKNLNRAILLKFGLFSIPFAALGAFCFRELDAITTPIHLYSIHMKIFAIMPLSLVVGAVTAAFAAIELFQPKILMKRQSNQYFLGGSLSGFFGGLAGQQNSARSIFLAPLKLSENSKLATALALACLVDVSRLFVYTPPIGAVFSVAMIGAFLGSLIGQHILHIKVDKSVRRTSAIALVIYGAFLAFGIVGGK